MAVEIPSAAIAALELGNKIEAIKQVRAANGLDLKDSKDFIDKYLLENPPLNQRYTAIQTEKNRKGMIWFITIIILGIAAYYFFSEIQ